MLSPDYRFFVLRYEISTCRLIQVCYVQSHNIDFFTLFSMLYSDNDTMIGNRNRARDGSHSASKNGTVLQNRHAHCKVKSHQDADIPLDTRKSKEPGSNDKIDTVGRKKVQKGSVKSENVHRVWRF